MVEFQDDLDINDPICTFEVPITFTQKQLEKMLLAFQADAHDAAIFDEDSNSADVATTLAVKKSRRPYRNRQAPLVACCSCKPVC
jgi:hypothetical protein